MINIDRLLAHVISDAPQPGSTNREVSRIGGDRRSGRIHSGRAGAEGHTAPRPIQTGGLLNQAGALGAGALAGGLAGMLFRSKQVREIAGSALQLGAAAAIGGLAYKAYQNYREGKPVVPQSIQELLTKGTVAAHDQGPHSAGLVAPPDRSEAESHLILKAMLAAAAADGHLDEAEQRRIRERLNESGLDGEEQVYLSGLIAQPASIAELAAAAVTPELRANVYAAARLAIEPDSPEERDWLHRLAVALALPPDLKAHLDAIGGEPRAQAA